MKHLLTERQAADYLNLSVSTLQAWRAGGAGPRFVKLGKSVRYRPEELERYMAEAERPALHEPDAEDGRG